MAQKTRDLKARQTIQFYLAAMLQYRAVFILSFLQPVGNTLMTIGSPYFASKVLASILNHNAQVWGYFYWFAATSALGVLLNTIGVTRNMVMQARVMEGLHNKVFERLLQRSVGFYANQVSGKLVSDAMDFVTGFSQLVNSAFIRGLGFFMNIVVGLALIFYSSWQLGLSIVVILSLLTVWTVHESRSRSSLRSARLKLSKRVVSHLADSLVNAVTVKTFAGEAGELAHAKRLTADLRQARQQDWQRTTANENYRVSVLIFLQAVLLFVLIRMTRHDPNLLATGIFAFTYTITLLNRFFELNTITRQIEESLLQAVPITTMLLEPIEITDSPQATNLVVKQGAVDLDKVRFTYADNKNNGAVFTELSLHIQPGEKVGLVGPSGGGKSTLSRLLLRFDDIQGGTISIDGQNIGEVTQSSLRQSISYVPQEPLLFHRTISENIAYSKPDATEPEIIHAATLAHADTFIKGLPHGYQTVVGERGVKLSGGQRQRIAIARAILKDAPILVLDEATSALDSESEKVIQDALWKLMDGKTAIVIAHRLSTIQRLDRIIVLDEGRIIEDGTHQELLKRKGLYAKLWNHQSGGFIEA